MRFQPRHLTDELLLRGLDRELSSRRHSSTAAHLAVCAACRERRSRIDGAAGALEAMYVDETPADAGRSGHARNRLRARMSEAATQPALMTSGLPALAAPLTTLAAAAAAVTLLVRLIAAPALTADRDGLPVAALTPGATWNVNVGELCAGSAREQRPVPAPVRQRVLRDYRMENASPDGYELDYLITPELGGAPDARNLWPQRYGSGVWTASVKDELEVLLPRLVCERRLDLETAQRELARDWVGAYKKYFRTERPLARLARLSWGDAADPPEDLTYPVWRTASTPALQLISFSARR